MSFPYEPARFTADERLADAWLSAAVSADNRAFYVRESAAAFSRTDANRFAAVEAVERCRSYLVRHVAEYLQAVRYASELTERMQARGLPFEHGPDDVRQPVEDEDAKLAEMLSLIASLDAARDAGSEPTHLVFAVRSAIRGSR